MSYMALDSRNAGQNAAKWGVYATTMRLNRFIGNNNDTAHNNNLMQAILRDKTGCKSPECKAKRKEIRGRCSCVA